ncbi:MAG: hypothetical protein LUI10_07300 [Lachnospiraceae bacterium]|nr:hypothetical protein [Lachnospiraceae bacterium]
MAAWTAAVISGSQGRIADVKLLENITEQLISNDCRIIEESVEIILSTRNEDVMRSRKSLIRERLTHLETLVPYADRKQAKRIETVKSQAHSIL